jgi:hypothetical protein
LTKHDLGPFGIIGNFIPGHDFLFGILDLVFFVIPLFFSGVCGFVLGFFALPAILNKKFDDEFVSTEIGGHGWVPSKSAAFPAYHYHRARDYARAVISDKQAQKIFNHPSAEFRNQVGKPTIVMCHLFVFSERFFAASLIYFVLAELFGF